MKRRNCEHEVITCFVTTIIYPASNTGSIPGLCPTGLSSLCSRTESNQSPHCCPGMPSDQPNISHGRHPAAKHFGVVTPYFNLTWGNMLKLGDRKLHLTMSRSFDEIASNDKDSAVRSQRDLLLHREKKNRDAPILLNVGNIVSSFFLLFFFCHVMFLDNKILT